MCSCQLALVLFDLVALSLCFRFSSKEEEGTSLRLSSDCDSSVLFEWEEVCVSSADVCDEEVFFEGVFFELCCIVEAGAWACDGVVVGAGLEFG